MYAVVTDEIVPGAVEANAMGGGPSGDEPWRKANINELTDLKRYDPISGFPVYKALLCEVTRDGDGERGAVYHPVEYDLTPRQDGGGPGPCIYLDHNATSPMHPEVKETLTRCLETYGNPSSLYRLGREAKKILDEARRNVALLIHSTARRITFTGCGTEANNLAIKGTALLHRRTRDHIITSAIEHPSVLNTCRRLEQQGFRVTYLTPDPSGTIRPESLEARIDDRTCLVSIMAANNETGVIQPVRELCRIARAHGALFHTDAVQTVGKIPVDVGDLGVDLLSFSGHKFHGPKGVGGLFIRKGVLLEPLLDGGGQEKEVRSGTENLLGIAGMGKAAMLALENLGLMAGVERLRDLLETGILKIVPGARANGREAGRLPHTSNIVLPGIRGESLVLALDGKGVALASGSACHAGSPEPSHALLAMGLTKEEAHCSVRLSLGPGNTEEEIHQVLRYVEEIVTRDNALVRFVSCR